MAMRRISRLRRGWSDVHRRQLVEGGDRANNHFGTDFVRCRRRYGPIDFCADSLPLAAQCWSDLREELLEATDDPESIWAFRYFDLHVRAPCPEE
jgi:hypothetical protein